MLDKIDEIFELARWGFSPLYIQDQLDLDESPRRIAKFLSDYAPRKTAEPKPYKPAEPRVVDARHDHVPRNLGKPGRQTYDRFDKSMREILWQLFEHEGRDLYLCEMCGNRQEVRCVIHHTKYLGATFRDLMLVCQRCNVQKENQNLK